jgi:hypothetical protein
MNLEQLRKQAKELVKAGRTGDSEALERLGGREPILAKRSAGSGQGERLRELAGARGRGRGEPGRLRRGCYQRTPRSSRPAPGGEAGDRTRPMGTAGACRGWDGDPNRPGGPLNWAPILYVCHSSPAAARARRRDARHERARHALDYDRIEPVRMLLEAGADPNEARCWPMPFAGAAARSSCSCSSITVPTSRRAAARRGGRRAAPNGLPARGAPQSHEERRPPRPARRGNRVRSGRRRDRGARAGGRAGLISPEGGIPTGRK